VRDFSYQSETEYTPRYYDQTYSLDEIESVHYIIEPFSDRDGPAHTMLSFGFSGGVSVSVSPEIRKQRGTSFEILPALMNQFELVYMIGSDQDLI
jgi:Domain of unknown function (DUF4105)